MLLTPSHHQTPAIPARIRLCAFLALLVGLLIASTAYAGTEVIYNCPSAPGANENSGPWTVFGAPQNNKGSCTGGPGNFIGPLGGSMSAGSTAGVQVGVPAGSSDTILEADIWWYVPQQISGGTTFALASTNAGALEEADTPKDSSSTPDHFVLPSNSTELTLADYCSTDDYNNPCGQGAGEDPDLELLGSELTIADSTLPTATVTGGGLAGTGTLAGTEALTYSAQDPNVGVRQVQLLEDGRTVAEKNYAAECPYENFAACPTSVSNEIQWDTATSTNGTHELALRVIDAANNTSTIDAHTVTINNPGIGVNGSLNGVGPHIANGDPCAGEALEVLVNGRRRPPSVTYGSPVTVRGVLHCGTVPIRGARVAITTVGGPASAAISTSVQTALDGSFSYKVPRGADRKLRFSYTAYSNDPAPSATATATIKVRPKIRLGISPHFTSDGHKIRWVGTVSGGPYPPEGVTLDAEVREGRRWRFFEQIVADDKGSFHFKYRFHATYEPTTYTFRVALPRTGARGYPYTPGASNTVNVHVAP
jgi:hypothetical protein